jgi:hypothetical protein
MIRRLKTISSYIYLYVGFIAIVYNCDYRLRDFNRHGSVISTCLTTLAVFALYILINRLVVKRYIPVKILNLFESLIALILVALLVCFLFVWKQYNLY